MQRIGNSLKWGAVYDVPASFVWEIGDTSPFTSPAAAFCAPGEASCYSYDAPAWQDQSPPIHIESVTFGNWHRADRLGDAVWRTSWPDSTYCANRIR